MRKTIFTIIILTGCIGHLKAQSTKTNNRVSVFTLGDSKISINSYLNGQSNIVLFNMHENENTAAKVGFDFVSMNNGTFVTLKSQGQRLISFSLSNKKFTFDPNRIFTPVGIKKTLTKYGNYSEEAQKLINSFAKTLVDSFLFSYKYIVTLHNNTNNEYSIQSYVKGGEYENDADSIYINDKQDIDDFIFVTDNRLFNTIKKLNINCVLQNNKSVTDDGSLSVFCGNENIVYVNIECEFGHYTEQKSMLEKIIKILKG